MGALPEDVTSRVINVLKAASTGSEIEVSLNRNEDTTLEKYKHLLKTHVKRHRDSGLKLIQEETLDIAYNYDKIRLNNYRVTVHDIKNINDIMNVVHESQNHVVFSIVLQQLNKKDYISAIKKTRRQDDIIDVPNMSMRFRNSKETPLDPKEIERIISIGYAERNYITFRFKERVSLIVHDNDEITISTDITKVRQATNIKWVEGSTAHYEIEVELLPKKRYDPKKAAKYYQLLEEEITLMNKIIQGSWELIKADEMTGVTNELKKMMIGDGTIKTDLPAMQPVSAEIINIVDSIPNNYSVTDKADGEHYFMFIKHSSVYMLSSNMNTKKVLQNKMFKEFEDTIIDGEYIYLTDKNKFMFLGFDIMFYKGQDVRNDPKLTSRLAKMYEVMQQAFGQRVIPQQYSGKFDLPKMLKHYDTDIRSYMKDLNDRIAGKDNVIVGGKYFMFPLGAHQCEVFAFSNLMWNLYVIDKGMACPYTLDGLIYTSLDQKYTSNPREIAHQIYKWKPSSKNSIDFYIQFRKDRDTNRILDIYDNTIISDATTKEDDSGLENAEPTVPLKKVYRELNLLVGKRDNGIEVPTLFQQNENRHIAHLYVDRGEVRDAMGDMLEDNTVVEFAYNNDINIEPSFRWVPLRTRHDKTDMVKQFKRKYGNSEYVANSVWRSMMDKFEIDDIALLGHPAKYDDYMQQLKGRVNEDAVRQKRREDAYYQEANTIGESLRKFHNYIKTNLINTYCKTKNGNKVDVLDIACGRGGDIFKFYHARVGFYVGLDVDEQGIYDIDGGAIKRYEELKRTMVQASPMVFMVADATVPLNYNDQQSSMGKVVEKSAANFIKIFGQDKQSKARKFDILNCQFAIHYFLKNDTTWNNFTDNINRVLKQDGYFIFTTLDANKVHAAIKKDGSLRENYTTDDGKNKLLFEIKRQYPEDIKSFKGLGIPIDVHMAWIMYEGIYVTEYLVEPAFIVNELQKKCGLRLVETETFGNIMEINRDFFQNTAQFESVPKTRKVLMDFKQIYNLDDPVNQSLHKYSVMNRYYIFRKGS
jgi:SAM-dependent methyltransferase